MVIERCFFKVVEIVDYLDLNLKSIYRAIKRRQIPAIKAPGIGIRIDKTNLDQMLGVQGKDARAYGRSLAGSKLR